MDQTSIIQQLEALRHELLMLRREKELGATSFGIFQQPIDDKIAEIEESINHLKERI